jgi:uncharacterized protein (DUF58 family)
MSIYPTRTAVQLTLAGLVAAAAGIAWRAPNLVLWGGAVAIGVAFARAVTLLSVLRIRSAGFEMLWPDTRRVVSTTRGGTIELRAEVRNRDTLAARYDKLRVIASPALECTIEPRAGEVKATGSVELTVRVRALRAGFHGIHGLALEVRGAPGLFEVPLTFANPYGIEVLPHPTGLTLASPRGGRSQTVTVSGRASNRRGDGSELRELRELVAGDSFRRIAWKASARRGKLMTRELEREEFDVVLLVLDASVELWAGAMGEAPLDAAIDAIASLAQHHLARGDRVGLRILAGRDLAEVPFDGGRAQLVAITRALLDHTGVLDADRSGWNETELAVQVAEHLRPVDPRGLRDLRRGRHDRLAERAAQARRDAPFARKAPAGYSETDAELRRYAACFGLNGPPRGEPERERTVVRLNELLLHVVGMKPLRPSVIHVVAPPPLPHAVDGLRTAVRALRRKGTWVRWSTPPLAAGLMASTPSASSVAEEPEELDEATETPELMAALRGATEARALVATKKGEALLRSIGVKVSRGAHP